MFLPKNEKVLALALNAWRSGAQLRANRHRYKQYTYGKQWNDPVKDDNGNIITEDFYLDKTIKIEYSNRNITFKGECFYA